MIRGHAWMDVKTMVSMSALLVAVLLVAVACGDDDGPTAPTAPSPTPPMASRPATPASAQSRNDFAYWDTSGNGDLTCAEAEEP